MKIVDLTDAELIALGFMGDNVASGVRRIVNKVRASPDKLGSVTCFMVECYKQEAGQGDSPPSPTSPALSDAETLFSVLSNNSDARTVVAPDLISEYEMNFYYHGISGSPPKLLWRSNLESDPFPIPPAGTNFYTIPQKTAHGVFNTPLNELWDDTVVPQIKSSMKNRGLKYSAIKVLDRRGRGGGGRKPLVLSLYG
ncbi:hypothetical protein FRB90_000780 [Tulasnella sp. 427]|nr:hypothetical protein FRB90_000780 [Tulasnella sp. 427]